MAANGHIDITIGDAQRLAREAIRDLDGRNGDPLKRSNWIRERKLALIVDALIARLQDNILEVPK